MEVDIEAFLSATKSENTRRAIKSVMQDYKKWCADNSVDMVPLSKDMALKYIDELAKTKKGSTVVHAIHFISSLHKLYDHRSPSSFNDVKEKMKEISASHSPIKKPPLQAHHIMEMLSACEEGTTQGKRDKAILLLAYDAAMKTSDLVNLTVESVQHIQCAEDTKQAIKAWLTAAKIESGPLFVRVRRGGNVDKKTRLHEGSLRMIIKDMAKKSGVSEKVDKCEFSVHSVFRGRLLDLAAGSTMLEANQVKDAKTIARNIHGESFASPI